MSLVIDRLSHIPDFINTIDTSLTYGECPLIQEHQTFREVSEIRCLAR